MIKSRKIAVFVLTMMSLVVIGALILYNKLTSPPKFTELLSEYSCNQDNDCAAWLPKGTCKWEIIDKETAAKREAVRQEQKRYNKLQGIAEIEASCGGYVPVGTFCREGRCVGKMQYQKFYH